MSIGEMVFSEGKIPFELGWWVRYASTSVPWCYPPLVYLQLFTTTLGIHVPHRSIRNCDNILSKRSRFRSVTHNGDVSLPMRDTPLVIGFCQNYIPSVGWFHVSSYAHFPLYFLSKILSSQHFFLSFCSFFSFSL